MKKLLILLVLFTSCKTKQSTVIHKTDSIIVTKVIKVTPSRLNELVIQNVCDSLGNLKIINYTNTSDKVQTTLKTVKNTLILEVNIDSLKQEWIKERKTSILKEKIVVEKKYIPKFVYYIIIYSILATLFIFRKPLLRLIKPI